MMPNKFVIIDACIARSVGAGVISQTHKTREVVDALKSGPTGICFTPQLRKEWERHASRHMRTWLVQMTQRGRVRHEKDRQVRDFRNAVNRFFVGVGTGEEKRQAVLKDAHLTEHAILTKRAIFSSDDTQRRLLAELANVYSRVGHVQWINPDHLHPTCLVWLQNGCEDSFLGKIV
jgi:hypothetical protein